MQRIDTILIANRGEIVSRIIRTCSQMGIRSVAVFSEADREAPFVKEADLALYLGGSSPAESYLDQQKIIQAALQAGADAIHPGFGFLAENADFARAVQAAGLIFIGPAPEAIESMGSKSKAKALMQAHGVPTIPGYQGEDQSEKRLETECGSMGFPVLVKAAAGGGGKGMRIVESAVQALPAIQAAKREALSAFGNDELIIEKYFPSSRHVEFQVFGDSQGQVIHLLERECSIQRRYQKIIEESPSPALDPSLREKMGQAAVKAAQALSYQNAGTVEFLLAENGDFYFLEINTRLQVEHPVTEMITGLDLVQMQIEVAEGRPLRVNQEDIQVQGYAVEVRLYAEDPQNDFMPQTGTVQQWQIPSIEGLRVESGIETNLSISVFYDPMIAKLICHGADRASAQRKMSRTLDHLLCQGLTTNQDLLSNIFADPDFQGGDYDTHYLKKHDFAAKLKEKQEEFFPWAALAATLFAWQKRESGRTILKHIPSGWRNSFSLYQESTYFGEHGNQNIKYRFLGENFQVFLDEEEIQVSLAHYSGSSLHLKIQQQGKTAELRQFHIVSEGDTVWVQSPGWGNITLREEPRFPEPEEEKASGSYLAPMPSEVLQVLVQPGQQVKAGETLLILSSMKMENSIAAWEDGEVAEVCVQAGDSIEAGREMIRMKQEPA